MKKDQLHSFLSQLNLENKVVFRNRETNGYSIDFHKDISQRLQSIEPDAVYIFNSQPLILFFDLIENKKDLGELYKKVWSFDNTSIIFLIKETGIDVFNALNYIKNKSTLEKIDLPIEEILRLFNLWELESGKTWEWFQNKYIDKKKGRTQSKRVNERLFSNIKHVREDLKNKDLTESEANSLILRLIFIRYLIDRKIKIDDELISGKVGDLNERRKSFIQLIKKPDLLNELFKILNVRFNGVLFKENDIVLNQSQAEYLSGVFAGELDGDNSIFENFFFEIFDFSIIPVEVISGIYESLIDEEKRKLDSAVYTPSFLVDYILNDTVDEFLKENKPEDCTVFEVAVGSGIFLVQSLRRIIEKEIELTGNKDNKVFAEKIKGFAENNLFGIDINPQALKVTCFSIYIALLDYLEPADINVYQFPELIGKNLFECNFFGKLNDKNELEPAEFEEVIKQVKPKFILGNPPWKSKKDDPIHTNWLKVNKKTVGRFEIAQSFLLRVKDFMTFETKSSLILTSTMFYNVSKTTRKFKSEVLKTYCLDKFFDLSAVKQSLFETQESPTSIIFFRLSTNNEHYNNVVKHHSLKVNSFLKNFRMLVIEKFDQKEILQKHFIENEWMFKVALYGNTLDFYLIDKLNTENNNILDLVNDGKIIKGAGIERGKDCKNYKSLIGLPIIENNSITDYYSVIDKTKMLSEKDVCLSRGRRLEIFLGKKILLKEQSKNWNKPIFSFVDEDCVFRKGTFSLSSNDTNFLNLLYITLISDLYTYYLFCIAGAWGIGTRPAIRFDDEFLNFPIKEINNDLQQRLTSLFHSFLIPIKKFYEKQPEEGQSEFKLISVNLNDSKPPINNNILSQINEIINEIYGITNHEKDLIDYALNVSRYQFQESKQDLFTERVDDKKEFLGKYAEVYLNEFSEIYPEEFIQVEIFPLEHFIAMNFVTTKEPSEETISYSQNKDIESVLKILAHTLSISQIVSTSDPSKNLFIQKDIKGFEEDSFYIIKPNEYKCWHRAMAWYDVAEFKEAIQKAELDEFYTEVE